MGLSPAVALAASVLYELVEIRIESSPKGQEFFRTTQPEIAVNQVVDLTAFAVGYAAGKGPTTQR